MEMTNNKDSFSYSVEDRKAMGYCATTKECVKRRTACACYLEKRIRGLWSQKYELQRAMYKISRAANDTIMKYLRLQVADSLKKGLEEVARLALDAALTDPPISPMPRGEEEKKEGWRALKQPDGKLWICDINDMPIHWDDNVVRTIVDEHNRE